MRSLEFIAAVAIATATLPSASAEVRLPFVNFINDSAKTVVRIRFETTLHRTRHILKSSATVGPGDSLHLVVPNLRHCIYSVRFVFDDGTTFKVPQFDVCHRDDAIRLEKIIVNQISMFA